MFPSRRFRATGAVFSALLIAAAGAATLAKDKDGKDNKPAKEPDRPAAKAPKEAREAPKPSKPDNQPNRAPARQAQAEPRKQDTPRPSAPKIDAPKAPKVDAPKAPKIDAPKPRTDQPNRAPSAPKLDAPTPRPNVGRDAPTPRPNVGRDNVPAPRPDVGRNQQPTDRTPSKGQVETRKPTIPDTSPDRATPRQPGLPDRTPDRIAPRQPTQPDVGRRDLPEQPRRDADRAPDRIAPRQPAQPDVGRRDQQPRDADRDRAARATARVTPFRIEANGKLPRVANNPDVTRELKQFESARTQRDIRQAFENLDRSPAVRNDPALRSLTQATGRFQLQLDRGDFPRIATNTAVARRFNLNQQYRLYASGDVARQMSFNTALVSQGGWSGRYIGPVYSNYTQSAFSAWYPGPSWYPPYVWMPNWSPWVAWSYWATVDPFYDPRPWIVRPYYYPVAAPLVAFDYPVWNSLPIVASGTWVDVPPVRITSGHDLQLLAVRFVDPGHPEEDMGPRYRVWVRNNANAPLDHPFTVTLVATNGSDLRGEMAQAGVTIESIDANDTTAVDIRLPLDANRLVPKDGHSIPFTHLHAVVDSHLKIDEADEANNGAVLARAEIFPVDPAAFSTDVSATAPGTLVTIAGEGFGPEPGEVVVMVGSKEQPAEVHGWYELGVQFRMPNISTDELADVQVLVVRGDGAASNPVSMQVAPEAQLGELPPAPRR